MRLGTGLGFGKQQAGISAPSLPATLPSIATAPQTAYGTTILVSGYSGPCVRVRRASDATEQDIGFVNGVIDMAAAISFAAGSELTITTWYDQSANGFHATQTTVANQPRLRPENEWRDIQGITFDGFAESSGGTKVQKYLSLPVGVTTNRRAISEFKVIAPKSSYNDVATRENGSTTTRMIEYTALGAAGVSVTGSSAVTGTKFWRGNPSVNGFRANASNTIIYTDETISTLAAPAAGSATGGVIGGTLANTDFPYRGEWFASVSYADDIGSTDADAVRAALKSAYSVSYDQTDLIVVEGDSGPEGTSDNFCFNTIRQVLPNLVRDVHMVNVAVHGTTASTEYARRAAKIAGANRTVTGKKILTLSMGSNDLNASVTGANLYNNSVLPYVQYAQGLGFEVIVSTILPRVDFTEGGAKDNERLAYNQLLRDNEAAEGFYLADYVALPELETVAATADTTYWYTDRIHLISNGMGLQAGVLYPIINAILIA